MLVIEVDEVFIYCGCVIIFVDLWNLEKYVVKESVLMVLEVFKVYLVINNY